MHSHNADTWCSIHLKGLVHGAPSVLICASIDVLEELLQGGIALQLLILLVLLDLAFQLVPTSGTYP